MKVLFCIDSLTKGGAERVICNLSNYLIEHNDVSIVTLNTCTPEYLIDKKIELASLENNKTIIYENEKNNVIKKVLLMMKRIRLMKKQIKKINPDIIISFLPYTSFITLLANKKLNKKVIVSVRNDPKIEYESKIYNFLMKKLYPKANGFVFQTKDAKKYFDEIFDFDYEIIPNPINPDFVCKPFNGKRKMEIVNVGRLYHQKNQKLLIEAFSKIADKYPNYKLIIYGEGIERNNLQHQINELNLTNKVILYGNVSDIKEKIYESSLFVLSSNFEGMPNALMEAMALGLPVISTDCPCGGPKFLIKNNESGILVPINDVEKMANAMDKILSDNKLAKKISKNANKIGEQLSPNIINKKWEEYILKILNK